MFARPRDTGYNADGKPKDAYYACGWGVRPSGNGKVNTWHAGLLDGSATLLVRRHDGLTWAVLFNADYDANHKYLVDLNRPAAPPGRRRGQGLAAAVSESIAARRYGRSSASGLTALGGAGLHTNGDRPAGRPNATSGGWLLRCRRYHCLRRRPLMPTTHTSLRSTAAVSLLVISLLVPVFSKPHTASAADATGPSGSSDGRAMPFLHPLFASDMVLPARRGRPGLGLDGAGQAGDRHHQRQDRDRDGRPGREVGREDRPASPPAGLTR